MGKKNAHPTDQFRRQQRQAEIKKTRDVAAAKKDPTLIKAKLDKLEQKGTVSVSSLLTSRIEKDGKNPKYNEDKKRRLQDLYAASLKRAKSDEKGAESDSPEEGQPPAAADPRATQPFPPQASFYYHPTLNPFGTPPPGAPQICHPSYTHSMSMPPGLAPPPGLPPGLAVPGLPPGFVPKPGPAFYPMTGHAPMSIPMPMLQPPPFIPPPHMHAPTVAIVSGVSHPIAEPLSEDAKKELDDMMNSLEQLPPKPQELQSSSQVPAGLVSPPPPTQSLPAPVLPLPPPPFQSSVPPPLGAPPMGAGMPHLPPPGHLQQLPAHYYTPNMPLGMPPRGMPGRLGPAPPHGMQMPSVMRPKPAIDPFAASNRAAPPPSAPAPVATPPPAPAVIAEKPAPIAISADVTAMVPAALRRAQSLNKGPAKPKPLAKPPVATAKAPSAALATGATDSAYDEFMANMKALGAM